MAAFWLQPVVANGLRWGTQLILGPEPILQIMASASPGFFPKPIRQPGDPLVRQLQAVWFVHKRSSI
jgi:hypothetical protein